MKLNKKLCVKLIHCGNTNVANPADDTDKNIFYMPMGFFPLANVLRANDFDSEIIHLDIEKGKVLDKIIDFSDLDVVGFDCHWVNQGLAVLETAALIKKIKPEVFIFLGGFTASLFSTEIVNKYTQIDAVIRGDGEVPIVELCSLIQEGLKQQKAIEDILLSSVQNLVWRSKSTVLVNDFTYIGTAEQMEKLDFAAVETMRNWEYYQMLSRFWTRFEPIASTPMFLLEVGRGCQFACTFCGGNCEAQRRMNNRKNSSIRSAESVVKTLEKAVNLGFNTFYTCFEYDGSDEWYIEFFNQIKKTDKRVNYIFGSWKLPSKKLIDSISETFENVIFEISPETSNEMIRKKNKDIRLFYSNSELEDCLSYIASKGNIKVQLYFGYFLVNDSADSVKNTIKYIIELNYRFHEILEAEYFNFSTDPGSLIFFYPEKYDIDMQVRNFEDYIKCIEQKYVRDKSGAPDMRIFKPKGLTECEVEIMENQINFLNYIFSKFRKTVSHFIKKTGCIDSFIYILEDYKYCTNNEGKFVPEKVKEILIKASVDNLIMDAQILQIANSEIERFKLENRHIKATPQIWLDFQLQDGTDEDDMIKYLEILQQNPVDDESISIDFTF